MYEGATTCTCLISNSHFSPRKSPMHIIAPGHFLAFLQHIAAQFLKESHPTSGAKVQNLLCHGFRSSPGARGFPYQPPPNMYENEIPKMNECHLKKGVVEKKWYPKFLVGTSESDYVIAILLVRRLYILGWTWNLVQKYLGFRQLLHWMFVASDFEVIFSATYAEDDVRSTPWIHEKKNDRGNSS